MQPWEMIVSVCAGIIVIINLFDKLGGISRKMKQIDKDYSTITQLPKAINDLKKEVQEANLSTVIIIEALRALIRNDLYICFKTNREYQAWTDDECRVQTRLHAVYQKLGGNGEESLWWQNKERWKIVSEEDYLELVRNCIEKH